MENSSGTCCAPVSPMSPMSPLGPNPSDPMWWEMMGVEKPRHAEIAAKQYNIWGYVESVCWPIRKEIYRKQYWVRRSSEIIKCGEGVAASSVTRSESFKASKTRLKSKLVL